MSFADRTPAQVRMVEVGPRDGLQNEPETVPTETKIAFIDALSEAGLPVIEASSFVSPKWIPQLADAAEVLAGIRRREGTAYPVLVPNERGMGRALAAGARAVAVFTAASEAFNRRNINCSIDQSLERFRPVLERAREVSVPVRGYISCVLGCPYQGEVPTRDVVRVARALVEMGCHEVSLGDTIGVGTPVAARGMLEAVAAEVPVERLAVHFHDTRGQALANILACLQAGVSTVDASVAGLGGCPYAHGASGNVATEDVLYMLHGMGIDTGVDAAAVRRAGDLICRALGRESRSKVALAG
ncbi:MAG TPA: hydroxymethylglutaryl-CoA lyase [Gammaproteobacteria bacterium]|nr:hydroxymethylglutaryl-CoA lyase [Gammaproteobacteria bacterium]